MNEVSVDHDARPDAEELARRALAIALHARPGGCGPVHRPLGNPDPETAQLAVELLEERATPGPFLDLALEILDHSR